jgi:lysophospholipase L1-like esterase
MDVRLASILIEKDSNGILRNVPNLRYKKWEINSLGFRGKEIDLKKREGLIRIVCLGLSETFGIYESKDKEWPSQLREILGDQFPNVEVINVSVAAQKLRKRKDYVKEYVLPLKPDIMVTVQGSLLPVMDFIRGLEDRPVEKKFRRKTGKRLLLRFREATKRCLPKWLVTRLISWDLRRTIRKKEKKHLINGKLFDKVPENFILEFENQIRSFIHFLKENHIVPVLLTFPYLLTSSNKELYKDIMLAARRLCVVLSEEGILDASESLSDIIIGIAEEENVAYIDNHRLIPKTLQYFVDYSHYTDKGAEFIAKNVYDLLIRRELIK